MVKSLVMVDVINGDYDFISEGKYRVTLRELKSILKSLGNKADSLIKSVKRNKKDVVITFISGVVLVISLVVFFNTISISSYIFMVISGADFLNNLVKRNFK